MNRVREFGTSPFLAGPAEPAGVAASPRARKSGERGSTLVEFAFIFVITLVLMFAMIDFARALYSYHFVTHAAREAARFASVRGQSCSTSISPCPAQNQDIVNFVTAITPLGIDPGSVQVYPATVANGEPICVAGSLPAYPGCPVSVQVNYAFNFIFPASFYNLAPVSFSAAQINMSSTSQIVDSR
jgi:Flp pilus assembly protein TadG